MKWTWSGWEAETDLGNDDDRKDAHFLTIAEDGEEIAVIMHRTCGGKHPLDGALAKRKEAYAEYIVDVLNKESQTVEVSAQLELLLAKLAAGDLTEDERRERIMEFLGSTH